MAQPGAPTFQNTVFTIGAARAVASVNSLTYTASRGMVVKTAADGSPNRIVHGSFEGTAEVELNENDANTVISGAKTLGSQVSITTSTSPTSGTKAKIALVGILSEVSASYTKDEENMVTLSFMLTESPKVNGIVIMTGSGGTGAAPRLPDGPPGFPPR